MPLGPHSYNPRLRPPDRNINGVCWHLIAKDIEDNVEIPVENPVITPQDDERAAA